MTHIGCVKSSQLRHSLHLPSVIRSALQAGSKVRSTSAEEMAASAWLTT